MKLRNVIKTFAVCVLLIGMAGVSFAENIDPDSDNSQYAWGENVGWLNFEPSHGPGVTVSDSNLTGYVWAGNIGWINLDPNDTDPNTGIKNDGSGNLSGYAWAENVGWINFNPQVPGDAHHYGVTIDQNGNFDGWAWGENIGWINFNSDALFGYGVKACKVNFPVFARFAQYWLDVGRVLPADLHEDNIVDHLDLDVFVDEWLDYCPGDWLF